MTQPQHSTTFTSRSGSALVLVDMAISGELHNALAVVEMVQTYRNPDAHNIEAIYSFPLPVEATLLQLSVRLNETLLLGRVAERKRAEAEYEEAMASGDTSVMLEQIEPGLYTMNVGNLMAGEQATVTLRYALPLKWEGQHLRLSLPSTIAPRYGDALEADIQSHQAPRTDLMTEHRYSLALQVLGSLGDAAIASPSHELLIQKRTFGAEIAFAEGKAFADRDLVLTLHALGTPASSVTVAPDGEGHIAHATFCIPQQEGRQNLALKILVDCSGSMAGDSMALARAGAVHALSQLELGDWFSVSAFGNTTEHDPSCRGQLMPGGSDSPINQRAVEYVRSLDATMGGTELLKALSAVFSIETAGDKRSGEGADVLLITDGESWNRNAIVQSCRASGHRVFVIGIGSSPSEAVVRAIVESTGGAAAFVSPNEDVGVVVERHIRRMRVPRLTHVQLDLAGEILWQSPARLDECVFAEDTVHVYCGLKYARDGAARLSLRYADDTRFIIDAAPDCISADTRTCIDLPRIAASARIRELILEDGAADRDDITELAVQYQIICKYTNYILVHFRGEAAATALPELHQTPSMLAAGWGGVGSVRESPRFLECRMPNYQASHSLLWGNASACIVGNTSNLSPTVDALLSSANTPAFMRKRRIPDAAPKFLLNQAESNRSPIEFITALNLTSRGTPIEQHLPLTLNEIVDLIGVSESIENEVTKGMDHLIHQGWPEVDVVAAFWLALLSSTVGHHILRLYRRALMHAIRQSPPAANLVQGIGDALRNTTEFQWSWSPRTTIVSPHKIPA